MIFELPIGLILLLIISNVNCCGRGRRGGRHRSSSGSWSLFGRSPSSSGSRHSGTSSGYYGSGSSGSYGSRSSGSSASSGYYGSSGSSGSYGSSGSSGSSKHHESLPSSGSFGSKRHSELNEALNSLRDNSYKPSHIFPIYNSHYHHWNHNRPSYGSSGAGQSVSSTTPTSTSTNSPVNLPVSSQNAYQQRMNQIFSMNEFNNPKKSESNTTPKTVMSTKSSFPDSTIENYLFRMKNILRIINRGKDEDLEKFLDSKYF